MKSASYDLEKSKTFPTNVFHWPIRCDETPSHNCTLGFTHLETQAIPLENASSLLVTSRRQARSAVVPPYTTYTINVV